MEFLIFFLVICNLGLTVANFCLLERVIDDVLDLDRDFRRFNKRLKKVKKYV